MFKFKTTALMTMAVLLASGNAFAAVTLVCSTSDNKFEIVGNGKTLSDSRRFDFNMIDSDDYVSREDDVSEMVRAKIDSVRDSAFNNNGAGRLVGTAIVDAQVCEIVLTPNPNKPGEFIGNEECTDQRLTENLKLVFKNSRGGTMNVGGTKFNMNCKQRK